jgi:flagellar biosynthesis/type III secretory pathway protein FliH
MTDPIPLAQFIQARRKLETPADGGLSQTGGGAAMRAALAEDLTADLSEVLPEQGATDPERDEAVAERQRELEQAYARGREEALAEFQVWWDDRATALQEITRMAQNEIEAGILASAINLVHTVSARHIREAAVDQLIQQVRAHLQQCADAVPLVTGSSDLGQAVAERFEDTGIQVVSSFDGGCEEVLVKVGDTTFETMIGMWTQEIESTLL